MIRRLCVIGTGLIGGSLALALRRAGYCNEIVGAGRSEEHLRRGLELGVIDRYALDPGKAVSGAEVVVVATPLGAMRSVCRSIKSHLAADAILTDVGSAKGSVVRDVRQVFGRLPALFVPGHPIAGTEKSGVESAFAELFEGRRVVLTPHAECLPEALRAVRAMWEVTGAVVEEMSVEHHDQVLAATSHLPHLLAFGLVDTLGRLNGRDEVFRYAAGGFRDVTRIASSDPIMWRDICLANRDAILDITRRYQNDLNRIAEAIARGDGEQLLEIFGRAKRVRDRFVQ